MIDHPNSVRVQSDLGEVTTGALSAAGAVTRASKGWHNWVKAGLITLSALGGGTAATITAVSAVVGYKAVKPQRRLPATPLQSPLLTPEQVLFKSTDGLSLNGYFYLTREAKNTLVMCHGFHGAAQDIHEAALAAQAAGYNAFTFDFRGSGASQGKHTSVGFWEVQDVIGAINYLKTRPEVDPERIVAYGVSMGGATVIMAAERCKDIKAVITDSSFASLKTLLRVNFPYFYRLPRFPFAGPAVLFSHFFAKTVRKKIEPAQSLQSMGEKGHSIPILIIHGELDKGIPVSEAFTLFEAAQGPKELWIIPQAEHAALMYCERSEYLNRIGEFLEKHLPNQISSLPL